MSNLTYHNQAWDPSTHAQGFRNLNGYSVHELCGSFHITAHGQISKVW